MAITKLNSKTCIVDVEKEKVMNKNESQNESQVTLVHNQIKVLEEESWIGLLFQKFDKIVLRFESFVQLNAIKIIFIGILILFVFCVPLKSTSIETDLLKLWTPVGGPLEEELSHTRRFLGQDSEPNFQILMQKSKDNSLLTSEAFLSHLQILEAATKVTVNLFDIKWRLKDICYSPSFPNFDAHYIDQIFEHFFPCVIMTPLDCFWEGSKLLGPDFPVNIPILGSGIRWTNLNPETLIQTMKSFNFDFPFDKLESFMTKAGITSAYQEKPCLNPADPECPMSKNGTTFKTLDLKAELSGGCHGFASNFMQWPESMLLGGIEKNSEGQITNIGALQSVIQLMGKKEFYEYWSGNYKVQHMEWSLDKAGQVLENWQKTFKEEVLKMSEENNEDFVFVPFSQTALTEALKDSFGSNLTRLGISFTLMILYTAFQFANFSNPSRSHSSLAILGILLSTLSTASALGFSTLLGIPFTSLTTEVLGLLSIALSYKEVTIILQNHLNSGCSKHFFNNSGRVLISGVLCRASGFFAAATLPIPALRFFSLQAGIVTMFTFLSNFFIFSAILSLVSSNQTIKEGIEHSTDKKIHLKHLVNMKTTKVFGVVAFLSVLSLSLWGCSLVQPEFTLSKLIPQTIPEHQYLQSQEADFGFYNIYMITKGDFNYPSNQQLLNDYFNALKRLPRAERSAFWLHLFRDWLSDLQDKFDADWASGCINEERWFPNASHSGILAYKLLVQTGITENPVDKSLVFNRRLVDIDGIIHPDAFYNYLTAWASNDVLGYGASQGSLRPEPRIWVHNPEDKELKIPKSAMIQYAQIPVYLEGVKSTKDIVESLKKIRDLCSEFRNRGLPNYPSGIAAAFWDQFSNLATSLILAFVCCFSTIFLASSFGFFCFKKSGILLAIAVCSGLQLAGLCGLMNAGLNDIFGELLLISSGIFAEFSVYYLTKSSVSSSLLHSIIILFLSIGGLFLSEFNFISQYFFYGITALIVLILFNGLIFYSIFFAAGEKDPEKPVKDNGPSFIPEVNVTVCAECNVQVEQV